MWCYLLDIFLLDSDIYDKALDVSIELLRGDNNGENNKKKVKGQKKVDAEHLTSKVKKVVRKGSSVESTEVLRSGMPSSCGSLQFTPDISIFSCNDLDGKYQIW